MQTKRDDTIKTCVFNSSSDNSITFFKESENNKNITTHLISIGHLKIYLRLRYPSYSAAARNVPLSSTQVRQICNGFNIPQNPEKIKQIANGWQIDPIILTQLFDRFRGKK